jgi:hypothetical protein
LGGASETGQQIQSGLIYGIAAKEAAEGAVKVGKGIKDAGGAWEVVKKGAAWLGKGLLTAAAAVAALAALAVAAAATIYQGKKKLSDVNKQFETEVDAINTQNAARKKYAAKLEENRKLLTESDYRRLRKGVEKNDRAVMAEVLQRFSPRKELEREWAKDLVRARAENIADPTQRAIALEQIKSADEREKVMKAAQGGTDNVRRMAVLIGNEIAKESNNRVAEILQKQLEEQRKIAANTKTTTASPFR